MVEIASPNWVSNVPCERGVAFNKGEGDTFFQLPFLVSLVNSPSDAAQ
jgi:hypothetical protein